MTMTTTSLIAPAIGLAACVTDLRSRRIPNVLTFGGALAGVLANAVTGGADGAGAALAGWLVGIAVFFVPFALGGMGAGDVKLVAALGAWLGPIDTLWLALYAGIAGGALAIAVAVAHGYLQQAFANIWRLLTYWRLVGVRPLDDLTLTRSRAPRLAYAVPIFVGAVVTVCLH